MSESAEAGTILALVSHLMPQLILEGYSGMHLSHIVQYTMTLSAEVETIIALVRHYNLDMLN